jgi:hypothetical protein
MNSLQINIIPSHKIDKKEWDDCIINSSNGLIYARSFYLDNMCDNWSGIILNNYETIMPVCWRQKFRIKYLYDVPFTQQLGWFSKNNFEDEAILLNALFKFCKYGDYAFNHKNKILVKNISCNNYIFQLSEKHEDTQKNYSADLNNNLKKAAKENLSYAEENIERAIELYKTLYHQRFQHVRENDFANFLKLAQDLQQQKNAFARKVFNGKNELLAVALLLKDEKRMYNLMNSTTEKGRKSSANHFLFDNILKEFSGTNLIFDFEGSDIEGIKKFYENFGAVNQPYSKIHFNNLSFPLKLLKR